MSTVRRPSAHRAYLREVSKQTTVVRLQGFLFFGTITNVEESIRSLVEDNSWIQNPIRLLVVDLSLVYGVDMSAAEAFVRLQRLLSSKMVVLVFCGFHMDSAIGKSLSNVGLFNEEHVECFVTFNDAMECENICPLPLTRRSLMYVRQGVKTCICVPGFPRRKKSPHPPWVCTYPECSCERTDKSVQRCLADRVAYRLIRLPWRARQGCPTCTMLGDGHLVEVKWFLGTFHVVDTYQSLVDLSSGPGLPEQPGREPANTIAKAFSYDPEFNSKQFKSLASYLERQALPEGHVLFKQGDVPDALFIIESGVLRALYRFAEHSPPIEESMVPGTLAGELTGLSGLERNATVLVERDAVVWKLSREKLTVFEKEQPELARVFTRLVMRGNETNGFT